MKTSHSVHISSVQYPLLSFASAVSSHLPLHVSFSLLTERLREPISHSCDLHPVLGLVSGVKVGRAKATCILQAGTQLTPPLSAYTAFSDSVHMLKHRGEQGQKSEGLAVVVTLVIS